MAQITRTILETERHYGEWMPENLVEAIAWLQVKLDSIPEENRASAEIELGTVADFEDSHNPSIAITYRHEETEQEIASRLAEEDARKAAGLRAAYARYLELKAVFGGEG